MRHIVIRGLPGQKYFPHYLIHGTNIGGGGGGGGFEKKFFFFFFKTNGLKI
jgi:hypothetical protein